MYEEEAAILIAIPGGYAPFVLCGRVSKVIGPYGAVITEASMIPYSGTGSTWAGIARGDKSMRRNMRVRMFGAPVRVGATPAFILPWEGELPTKDQN